MTFKPMHIPDHLYFVTATITDWQPLSLEAVYANIVLGSLDWLRQHRRWLMYAFVIMPTHLHTIVKPCEGYTISQVIQNFGSYTAHEILKQLQREQRRELLAMFREAQTHPQKEHQIWQRIQAKNIYSPAFLIEKFEYTHNNPINKGWELVADRADYRYSSACFYDRGEVPIIEVDDIRELL